MKTSILTLLLAVLVLISGSAPSSYAQKEVKTQKTVKVEKKKIWNTVCPIMGDEVDPKVQTVEYRGKTIGFCCKSCIKKFKKDPEKAMKRLNADGTKFLGSEGHLSLTR